MTALRVEVESHTRTQTWDLLETPELTLRYSLIKGGEKNELWWACEPFGKVGK